MSKVGKGILQGLEEAVAYAKGKKEGVRVTKARVPKRINVIDVRTKLKLTQEQFADRYGISVSTVRDWEQNRRIPRGPARVLLTIIDREPGAVQRALGVR